jgi:N-acetyl-beta-hexosaminidase
MIEHGLTHLILAAVHITDDGRIVLNDHEHTDAHHDRLWAEMPEVQAAGIPVLAMVGGWAPGTMCKLDTADFARYYPALRDFLRAHRFDGIDIDVEQDMSLEGVVALIDALRADFGRDFQIILAPVGDAMWGGEHLSGFDYDDLYRQRGDDIDFVNVQFYSGYGTLASADDYDRIVARGVYPAHKLVAGMIGNPGDGGGYVDIAAVATTVRELRARHPEFGGVDVWEYFQAMPGGADAPWEWIDAMRGALDLPVLADGEQHRSADELHLIPSPVHVERSAGRLTLCPRPRVTGPDAWVGALIDVLSPGTGLRWDAAPAGEGTAEAEIALTLDPALPERGYRLTVDGSGVRITAPDDDGFFAALSTLRQLLPAWTCGLAPLPGAAVTLPFVSVEDAPRFAWRGMHLDVGRHFQPLASLFRFVDLLALHKINRFHLHLTDDQGWRFEVKKYPKLTQAGAWRTETHYPHWNEGDGTPHGGFYTQDQLRALVGYAAQRGIAIVPEIDMPGHVRALLTAYPEFGEDPTGAGYTVATGFGVFDEVLHLTDETVAMTEGVFAELIDVFPSEFIHIGGDECPKAQWQNSDAAKRLAAERGLEKVELLQRWFTAHLRDWLAERGRRLVGWDEIVEDAHVPGALVMSWRGTEPGLKALENGNDVVMSPWRPTYLDAYQSDDQGEPYAIGGHTTWQDVLSYDPGAGIPDEHLSRLLGVQGQLWTEYMPSAEQVQYMAFPRVAALAEVAWAAGPVDADEFGARLATHLTLLDASGVNYRPLDGPRPWQQGGTGRYARPAGHGLGD